VSRFQTELVVRPYPSTAQCDGRNWVLVQDMIYRSDLIGEYIVPRGFTTDFASVPAVLWADIPPFGKWGPAAVLHDAIYWFQGYTREQADRILMEAMQDLGVDWRRCALIYDGVRIGGQHAWDQDARDRAAGKPHVSE
jgi:hypothetical protein